MKPQSLKAMEQSLKVILDEATGPAATKLLADTWRGAHNEVMNAGKRRSRVDPAFTVAADNDQRKPPEQARSLIVSNYDYRREVANATIDALEKASPRKSGAYVRAHTIFVNGKPVGKVCPPIALTDDLSISNPVPYARRLEVGKTKSGRDFVIQVPSRIYERTMKEIRAQYRDVAKISFTYRALLGGGQVNQVRAASKGQKWWLGGGEARAASGVFESMIGKKFGKTAHNQSSVRFPTILIEAL
jgi:hypothetical protein